MFPSTTLEIPLGVAMHQVLWGCWQQQEREELAGLKGEQMGKEMSEEQVGRHKVWPLYGAQGVASVGN